MRVRNRSVADPHSQPLRLRSPNRERVEEKRSKPLSRDLLLVLGGLVFPSLRSSASPLLRFCPKNGGMLAVRDASSSAAIAVATVSQGLAPALRLPCESGDARWPALIRALSWAAANRIST